MADQMYESSLSTKELICERIIPTVLGVIIGCYGLLFMFGVICNRREERQRIAPASMSNDTESEPPQTRATAEQRYGPVACQAQLRGMSDKERRAVLEQVFVNSVTEYDQDQRQTMTAAPKQLEDGSDTTQESSTNNGRDDAAAAAAHAMERGLACVCENLEDMDSRCCAICLRDYENGEQVMTGTTCDHLFHYDCAMEWLANHKRPKDYCPYCRNPMMTPTEMRLAALATLGEDRVREMTNAATEGNNLVSNDNDSNVTNDNGNGNRDRASPF